MTFSGFWVAAQNHMDPIALLARHELIMGPFPSEEHHELHSGCSSRREEKTDVKIGSSSFCNLAESSH